MITWSPILSLSGFGMFVLFASMSVCTGTWNLFAIFDIVSPDFAT